MEVAANAALLACALAWRGVVGWVVRARAERFAGGRLGVDHPALDLLIGLLAGWTAFAIWSTLFKRALGTSAPLVVFALSALVLTPDQASAMTREIEELVERWSARSVDEGRASPDAPRETYQLLAVLAPRDAGPPAER